MMAKRVARSTEMKEKSHEVRCMWGLFGILESCQGHAATQNKMISNGRKPVTKHIIDNPRKLIQPASFDEECRKLKNEADLATKESPLKDQKSTKPESELFDHVSKTQKRAKKKSQKVNHSSSYESNTAASLINQPTSASTSTSAEQSLNKLKFSAILEALCAQNHREEITLSESLQRSITAKALLDQMFIEKRFLSQYGTSSGSQSFSNAVGVLNPNKDYLQKLDHQYKYPSRTNFTDKKPSDKIVILKPAPQNALYSGKRTCHCSSDVKTAPFSFREMKKKLKCTFQGTRKGNKLLRDSLNLDVGDQCTCHRVERGYSHTLCKKQDIESNLERKKLDFSSGRFIQKHEVDVTMEAKKHLSTRLKNLNSVDNPTSKKSVRTLGRILSSPEHDIWPSSPRRDGQDCSVSPAQMRFSPYCLGLLTQNKEVATSQPSRQIKDVVISCDDDYDEYESTLEISQQTTVSSPETNSITGPELNVSSETNSTDTTELQKEDENDSHSVNDCPSTPSRIYQLDTANNNNKVQQEHQSPVSVLDPFFVEDSSSPSSITPQMAGQFSPRQQMQPRRLDFEEDSFESSTSDPPTHTTTCMKDDQDYISDYVHLVLQASCLNWDNLSETITWPLPDELLDASLFDDLIEFQPPSDCYFDPKILFDHLNEVLQGIHQSHFCSTPRLSSSSSIKSRIRSVPLEEVVLDEIMKEDEFYLLPWTEKRTLNEIVCKDVTSCGSWPDVRHDTEQIVIDISEDLVQGSILELLLELHT